MDLLNIADFDCNNFTVDIQPLLFTIEGIAIIDSANGECMTHAGVAENDLAQSNFASFGP